MFDLPQVFSDGSIGVAIVEYDEGWAVLMFRSPEIMVAHAAGQPLSNPVDFVSTYVSRSLIDCIHFVHHVDLSLMHKTVWGF